MRETPVRRIVTGHDAHGRAVIVSDAPTPHVRRSEHRPGVIYHNLWTTAATPAPIDGAPDPVTDAMTLPPPRHGSNFRIVEFGPESEFPPDAIDATRGFGEMGDAPDAVVDPKVSRHAAMHRTQSVDYGLVLEGEIWLVMDVGETLMRAGDVCVQRGTNHAWSNRSGRRCVMAFTLIDGA
jgi:hypothetical protein